MDEGIYGVAAKIIHILTHQERLTPGRPKRLSKSVPATPDKGFKTYRDPAGRFELNHPAEWVVGDVDGLHLHSPAMGSFARVMESTAEPWTVLESSFRAAGGQFLVERQKPGRGWGTLDVGGRRFAWDATLRGGLLLLIGNVVDASRGTALERYEDRALAALRRSFKTRA